LILHLLLAAAVASFTQCGVLLGYLIDLGDGLVNLVDAVALPFAGGSPMMAVTRRT
jgi:hypothetical protein